MMGLKEIGETLPPGFRFCPSDEELVCHYLFKKIANEQLVTGTLVEIDLHTCEPWMLPDVAKLNSEEWYFFSFRYRKYATGFRTNRATMTGYWKATGKDRPIVDTTTYKIVGMRKTLVFYKHRAPNGLKTSWILHEFRLENPGLPPKEDWVLCRVFNKSRTSPYEHKRIIIIPQDHNPCDDSIDATSSHTQFHENKDMNVALVGPKLGHIPQSLSPNIDNKVIDGLIGSKCEDEYGFLLDLCEPNGFGLDDTTFGEDNSSVFM